MLNPLLVTSVNGSALEAYGVAASKLPRSALPRSAGPIARSC
eukprot:COSAG02_NODE_32123_length_522_cov_0.607565_1_plen_41_part_01